MVALFEQYCLLYTSDFQHAMKLNCLLDDHPILTTPHTIPVSNSNKLSVQDNENSKEYEYGDSI